MSNWLLPANSFLASTLKNDVTLLSLLSGRVYLDVAPEKDPGTGKPPAYPLIVFSLSSQPNDTQASGARNVLAKPTYLIRAIGTMGLGDLVPVDRRIQALLNGADATVTFDGANYSLQSTKQRDYQSTDMADGSGVRYAGLGGFFKLYIQQIP